MATCDCEVCTHKFCTASVYTYMYSHFCLVNSKNNIVIQEMKY